MTPRYTIGVWVGNDKNHLDRTGDGRREGGAADLDPHPREDEGARKVDPQADFDPPPNVVFTAVDYETGLRATPESPRPILEAFVSGSQPTEEWDARWEEITRRLVAPEVVLHAQEGGARRVHGAPISPEGPYPASGTPRLPAVEASPPRGL